MGYSSGALADNISEAVLTRFDQKAMRFFALLGVVYSGFLVRYGRRILSRCMVSSDIQFREEDRPNPTLRTKGSILSPSHSSAVDNIRYYSSSCVHSHSSGISFTYLRQGINRHSPTRY